MNKVSRKVKVTIFLLLVLSITIGYAALQSTLSITGTSTINNATWNIHWDNLNVTTGSITGTKVITPAYIKPGDTEVSYSIVLSTPGEYYEFTVDAVNDGSIDAMIGSFSNKVYEANGTTERTLPDYLSYSVTYGDGIEVATNQKLSANSTETYKVRVEYKTDIDASQIPSSADTIVFKFNVNYVQADDSAVDVRLIEVKYSTNILDFSAEGYNCVWLNRAAPNYLTLYDTPDEAKAAFSNSSFYFKHIIENNIVTKSYACLERNGNTYCIRGGVDESSLTEKPIYEENKRILTEAFGESNCYEDGTYYNCGDDVIGGATEDHGSAQVGSETVIKYCQVHAFTYSGCRG